MKKILSLTLCALFVLSALCACGKTPAEPDTPTAVLKASLDALKRGESDENSVFGSAGHLAGDDGAMYDALFGSISYTVKDERIDGDTAEVDIDLETVDITAALGAYLTEAGNHADDDAWDADGGYFISLLKADDAAKKSFSVTACLDKVDGAWVLTKDANTDLLNAVTGGLYDYANTELPE